eukprot:4714116-Pleurochrysis_carterae.AAC.1
MEALLRKWVCSGERKHERLSVGEGPCDENSGPGGRCARRRVGGRGAYSSMGMGYNGRGRGRCFKAAKAPAAALSEATAGRARACARRPRVGGRAPSHLLELLCNGAA